MCHELNPKPSARSLISTHLDLQVSRVICRAGKVSHEAHGIEEYQFDDNIGFRG